LKKLENLLTKHLNNHTLNKALGKCNLFSTAMAKRLKPVELFLAVGLAATVGACGGPATEGGEGAEGDTTPPTEVAPEGGEAGEGGEGGESGESGESGEGGEGGEAGASGNPDTDYMTSLALMKGHLIVAEELITAGNYQEAEPHIGHPVEELYGGIEPQLAERGVPQFKEQLNELHDLAKTAPESDQLKTEFEESLAAIDSAIAALPEEQRESPEFVLDVMTRTLQTAAEEYEAAIVDDKFVELVEYQDSRGFVIYADELYQNIAQDMSQNRPDDHAAITESLQELKTIWPSVNPPETPVAPPSQVYSLVSEIELRS
jgi:hypothetical protein